MSVNNTTAVNIKKVKAYRNLYGTILRKGKKDFFRKTTSEKPIKHEKRLGTYQ